MKREIKHHSFTLLVKSVSDDWFPVLDFDESDSFDEICLTMITLDDRGVICSLNCETWSTFEEVFEDD